ncbi:MAG: CDP-archaeol synthase [Clostridia bacterium]|nr:CDP-archaeol synthase [Clostridia bacterium]
MKARLISTAVGVPLALGIIALGAYFPLIIDIALAIIAVMCIVEGLSAKKLNKKLTMLLPCTIFCVLFFLFYSYKAACMVLVFGFIVALYLSMVVNHENLEFPDLSFALTITTMCLLGLWSIEYMFDTKHGTPGLFYVVISLAIPWFSDGGAYFGGSALGKHKLCPKISPKKTVEGAVTGLISGMFIPMIAGVIFTLISFKDSYHVNYINFAIIGLFVSVISILGDLSFSLIKRSCGIKDYGSLIPGHGGMLDRFDSVIFAAPLIMIMDMILPIVTPV